MIPVLMLAKLTDCTFMFSSETRERHQSFSQVFLFTAESDSLVPMNLSYLVHLFI